MTPDEAFELAFSYAHSLRKLDIAVRTLKEIADEDFRGNRPTSAFKAEAAIAEMGVLESLDEYRKSK